MVEFRIEPRVAGTILACLLSAFAGCGGDGKEPSNSTRGEQETTALKATCEKWRESSVLGLATAIRQGTNADIGRSTLGDSCLRILAEGRDDQDALRVSSRPAADGHRAWVTAREYVERLPEADRDAFRAGLAGPSGKPENVSRDLRPRSGQVFAEWVAANSEILDAIQNEDEQAESFWRIVADAPARATDVEQLMGFSLGIAEGLREIATCFAWRASLRPDGSPGQRKDALSVVRLCEIAAEPRTVAHKYLSYGMQDSLCHGALFDGPGGVSPLNGLSAALPDAMAGEAWYVIGIACKQLSRSPDDWVLLLSSSLKQEDMPSVDWSVVFEEVLELASSLPNADVNRTQWRKAMADLLIEKNASTGDTLMILLRAESKDDRQRGQKLLAKLLLNPSVSALLKLEYKLHGIEPPE